MHALQRCVPVRGPRRLCRTDKGIRPLDKPLRSNRRAERDASHRPSRIRRQDQSTCSRPSIGSARPRRLPTGGDPKEAVRRGRSARSRGSTSPRARRPARGRDYRDFLERQGCLHRRHRRRTGRSRTSRRPVAVHARPAPRPALAAPDGSTSCVESATARSSSGRGPPSGAPRMARRPPASRAAEVKLGTARLPSERR
jgi:hypothetical protein